jgi:hypothetical protein
MERDRLLAVRSDPRRAGHAHGKAVQLRHNRARTPHISAARRVKCRPCGEFPQNRVPAFETVRRRRPWSYPPRSNASPDETLRRSGHTKFPWPDRHRQRTRSESPSWRGCGEDSRPAPKALCACRSEPICGPERRRQGRCRSRSHHSDCQPPVAKPG